MYKRTSKALANSTPPNYTCMFKAQFGKAEYCDIAFAITTRIDAAGCFGVIEYDMGELSTEINEIYMETNISNSITTVQKDALVAKPNKDTATTLCLNSKVDGKQPSLEHRVYDSEGISTAMTTGFHPSIQEPTSYRIRKLTPRECFRLMGVSESDIDKIQQSGISNSQQYKMAGNSIVVDVLYYIFKNMFVPEAQNKADNNGLLCLF